MISLAARLALVLSLVCGAVVGVTLRIGASVASAHESLLTRNSCTLPCLFGVTPGVSTRDQAILLFEGAGVSYSYYNPIGRTYPMHTSAHPISLMMYMSFGNAYIGDVRWLQLLELAGSQSLGNLGDFVLAGYQPTQVYASCMNAQRLILTFSNPYLFFEVANAQRLEPETPVIQVSAASDADAQTRSLTDFACAVHLPWRGFAFWWAYQSAS